MHHVDAGGALRTVRESHCRVDDDEIARCILAVGPPCTYARSQQQITAVPAPSASAA